MPESKRTTVPVDLVLRISTRWDESNQTFEYRLCSPSGAVTRLSGKPHRSEKLGPIGAFQRNLLDELQKLRMKYDAEGVSLSRKQALDSLAEIGRWLYPRLFPESLRKAYLAFRTQARTLLLVSDEAWIPWELVRPYEDRDDDFLCMQFEMSRWLSDAGQPVAMKGLRRLLCVTVGAPEGQQALEEASSECKVLQDLAAGPPKLRCRVLDHAASVELREQLLDGVDLVHYAGHGRHSMAENPSEEVIRPEQASIELADRPFRARELSGILANHLKKDRPVVFFNSCEAGRLDPALTGLAGWAESWIKYCGASAFLAPFLRIEDATAREFAAIFYRELKKNRTLGQALSTARSEIRDSGAKDHAAFLAYRLYGHPNLQLSLDDDVVRTISIGDRVSPLSLPENRWRPNRSSPGALLRAEYGIVPFHFRSEEIDNLETWCRSGDDLAIRLYTGAGGMGKTRLALEICQRMRAEGWQAGLVDHERPAEETWQDLVEIGGPRLLIVDYAETRRPFLVPLLKAIDAAEGEPPIRLLLLARAALDWWDQLKAEGDGVGELLSGPATRWHTLMALASSLDNRAESYDIAANAFADRLGRDVPENLPDDLEADHFKRALLLHMTALAAIEGVDVKGEDGILDYILGRERRFWGRLANDWELPKTVVSGIGRAMAAITLGGGVDGEENAVLAMRGLSFFVDEKENILIRVARLLRDTYPGDNRWIEPLMPDLLGEHLIMREMELNSKELLDLVLGPGESK